MSDFWQFSDGEAVAALPDGEIRLDPTKPTEGALLTHGETKWPIFSVQAMPSHGSRVLEAYARSADVIAQYGEGKDDTYRYHLYWRILGKAKNQDTETASASENGGAAGVELWLGVQTGLLDSTPQLKVTSGSDNDSWQVYEHSELCSDGTTSGSEVAALVSRSDSDSGVWLIEPSDQMHATLTTEGGLPSVGLFGHFMEKGVIRRGRMRFHVFPGVVSLEQIVAAYNDFATSELPLTA